MEAEEALRERKYKYRILRDITDIYKETVRNHSNFTSEEMGNRDLKTEFANSQIGKTYNLYIDILDINVVNGHRQINIAQVSTDIYFRILDDDKNIENAKRGDKMDIIVTVDRWYYEKNTLFPTLEILYIILKVIEMEKNYGYNYPVINNLLKDERLR